MKPDSLADAIPHTPASEYPPLPCRQYQRHGTTAVPNAFATYRKTGDSVTVADMKTRVKPHQRLDVSGETT